MSDDILNIIENAQETLKSFSEEELNKKYLKVNLPDTMDGFESGNGEGCWAIPLTDNDQKIILDDEDNTKAKIILCNSSIYHPPLVFGSVLQVEMREGYRPVLDIYWLHEQLKPANVDFIGMLEGE